MRQTYRQCETYTLKHTERERERGGGGRERGRERERERGEGGREGAREYREERKTDRQTTQRSLQTWTCHESTEYTSESDA